MNPYEPAREVKQHEGSEISEPNLKLVILIYASVMALWFVAALMVDYYG